MEKTGVVHILYSLKFSLNIMNCITFDLNVDVLLYKRLLKAQTGSVVYVLMYIHIDIA